MKAITKLYLSKEEMTKIETMIDDIEDFLTDMSYKGISDCCNNEYDHLVEAQDLLELFRAEVEGIEDEEE